MSSGSKWMIEHGYSYVWIKASQLRKIRKLAKKEKRKINAQLEIVITKGLKCEDKRVPKK